MKNVVLSLRLLFVNVLVDEIVGTTTPSTAKTPAEERLSVVSDACPNSSVPTPNAVEVSDDNLVKAMLPLSIALVTDPVSPVVTNVPVISGIVIVLSTVGSVTDKVVSNASAVAPSKIILPSLRYKPLIVGLVKVLFVNVSVPAIVASVPVAPGSVIVEVPATAGATKVDVPLVEPGNIAFGLISPFFTLNSFAISFPFPRKI